MTKAVITFLLCLVSLNNELHAQFINFAKPYIDSLCSQRFAGRGYVNDGVNIAADFLGKSFKEIGLKTFNNSYFQNYYLKINTFPNPINCKLDGISYDAGEHFLVSPDCPDIKGNYKLYSFDVSNEADKSLLFQKLEKGISPTDAYVFRKSDEGKTFNNLIDSIKRLGYKLPLVIKATEKKLLWWTSQQTENTAKLIFPDSIISQYSNLELNIDSKFIDQYPTKNVIGFIPGKKKTEKYIVFTAHYDHLGMLGDKAVFPGASDNASGVSLLLSLADYYSKNKQNFPIIFILFSGEEVGLKGSEYFVENPLFKLENTKMLINLDIMGNATDGITVVNGEKEKDAFETLTRVNKNNKFLPHIKLRGKASNSDHYHFSEAGVPAVFIYSNGGPGFYHDVWDKPDALSFDNIDNVAKLLIEFLKQY